METDWLIKLKIFMHKWFNDDFLIDWTKWLPYGWSTLYVVWKFITMFMELATGPSSEPVDFFPCLHTMFNSS